jgi:hypothetical protein
MALEMSYGKNVGKFKPKVHSLQGASPGEKNRVFFFFSSQSLKIESFKKKSKPRQGLQCLIKL